jgi:MFS transporter, DHA1 family, inner membrane transport protein
MRAKSVAASDSEHLDRRFMATLCIAVVAGLINNAALGPFIPDIARDFDSSVPVVGQVATASWLMSAIAGIFAGPLADHYGHRRLLATGLLLTMISALFVAAAQGYWWLVLGRMIGGLGFSASIGVGFALATLRYSGKARLRAMSILASSMSVAAILGIPVLTTIGGQFSWRGAWVFIAILALLATLMLFASIPAVLTDSEGRFRLRNLAVAYTPLLRDGNMRWLFSASALQGALFLTAITYAGSYFIEDLGLSVQQFGMTAVIFGTGFFVGSLTAGRLGRFDLRVTFIWTTLIAGVLLVIAYSFSDSVAGTMVVMTAGFFFASIQAVNIITLISNETTGGQGTTMVVNESVFAIGAALGAATGGLLIQFGGYQSLGFGIFGFALAATLAVQIPGKHAPRSAPAPTDGE